MKNYRLLLLCLFLTADLFCQDPKVTWGKDLAMPRKSDIADIIGFDKNSFYCLRSHRSLFNYSMSLEKYSKAKLTLEYVKEFKLPDMNGKQLQFERIFLLKGTFLVFASAYDKEQDKNIAYVEKIDAASGSVASPFEEVDHINAIKKRNAGSFDFILSSDSGKILIARNEPYDKYANEKFCYKLLDSRAKVLWTAELELPYKDKYFSISNYRVDGEGKVFMMATVTKEKEEREKKKPNYSYSVISYDPQKKKLKETEISLGDRFISGISFALTSKGTLAIGGFYSNKTSDGQVGTFFMAMDKETGKIITRGDKDFSKEFLMEFMSERRAEKQKELYNYRINYIVTKDDGGIYLVAEQYYMQVVTNYNPKGGSTTTYHYYYNDIIVINLNPNASIEWVRKIPKYQHTVNDNGYYSSYSFFTSKNKLYFVYNDHPKNLLPDQKKIRSGIGKKMVTVLASVDVNGKMDARSLFAANEEKIYARPKMSYSLSDNELLFYAIRKKKSRFGIINY